MRREAGRYEMLESGREPMVKVIVPFTGMPNTDMAAVSEQFHRIDGRNGVFTIMNKGHEVFRDLTWNLDGENLVVLAVMPGRTKK